jgi:hypothetical protein
MKRPYMSNVKKVAMSIVMVTAAAVTGCATSGTSAGLASVQGGAADPTQACAGVPAKERELGLMSYKDAIGGTAPMHDRVSLSKGVAVDQEVGVQIAVRAQQGLTGPWLARVATCHAALAAAGQLESRDAKDDPLVVPGISVSVEEAPTGFVVSIRAPNASAATEVTTRAVALVSGPTSPATAQAE